jgi:prevent-host-death family protein
MEVGIRELRQNLSELLDRVTAGEEILVQRHGRVVARLLPPDPAERMLPSMHEFRESVQIHGRPLSEEVACEREASRY